MTKYKNIEKYMPELKMFPINMKEDLTFSDHGIKASDLEALLAKGVEVYGAEQGLALTYTQISTDTHSGILIGYKPIESQEPISKSEIVSKINDILNVISELDTSNNSYKVSARLGHSEVQISELINRIEKNGVKNE